MEKKIITNPAKAIRAYCLSCVGGSSNEVKLCPVESCQLFPFRFGKSPYRPKREYSEEERQAMRERMIKMQERRRSEKQQ